MELILVESLDEGAQESLRANPHVRVLSVVERPETAPAAPRVRRKWAGTLSDEAAEGLRKHVEELRNEWERDF